MDSDRNTVFNLRFLFGDEQLMEHVTKKDKEPLEMVETERITPEQKRKMLSMGIPFTDDMLKVTASIKIKKTLLKYKLNAGHTDPMKDPGRSYVGKLAPKVFGGHR